MCIIYTYVHVGVAKTLLWFATPICKCKKTYTCIINTNVYSYIYTYVHTNTSGGVKLQRCFSLTWYSYVHVYECMNIYWC